MASLAPSLVQFRAEVNTRWPQRDHASDGWIGDAAHADRPSDHNPGARGFVHAFDTDEDLDGNTADNGRDAWVIAEHLRLVKDQRIKYVIYEGRMFSSYSAHGYAPWAWRQYTGANEHRKHLHLSIYDTPAAELNTRPWLASAPKPGTSVLRKDHCIVQLRVLKLNDRGGDVRSLQYLLNHKAGQELRVDAAFGPSTKAAVQNVQRWFKITPDGICGDKTWPCLFL